MPTPCSCGLTGPHTIARRQTADGATVVFWHGALPTWALGVEIAGVGPAREGWSADADVTASAALMGVVELLDRAEVAGALQALRAACRQPYHRSCTWGWASDRGGPSPSDARRIALGGVH